MNDLTGNNFYFQHLFQDAGSAIFLIIYQETNRLCVCVREKINILTYCNKIATMTRVSLK